MSTLNIKKILVPVDFSEAGEKAIGYAIEMAKNNIAAIVFVHVIESLADTYSTDYLEISKAFRNEFESMLHNAIKEKMEELRSSIYKLGVKDVEYFIESGKTYKKVIELSKSIKADIIIMGTHGVSGFKEFAMGSNTFKVVGGAICPILSIQQKGKSNKFTDILLPFRSKTHSREGVDYAIRMAKFNNATIHILGINVDPAEEELKKVQFEAKQIANIIENSGVNYTTDVLTGSFSSQLILSFAENKKTDMIVMVSDLDKMGLTEYIVGPVVQQVVNHSHIPVLSIRPKNSATVSTLTSNSLY